MFVWVPATLGEKFVLDGLIHRSSVFIIYA